MASGRRLTLEPMDYTWAGVEGRVPRVEVDLESDPSKDMFFAVILYEGSDGDRQVVKDGGALLGPSGMASSTDRVMGSKGYRRCFMLLQAIVHAGVDPSGDGVRIEVFEHESVA